MATETPSLVDLRSLETAAEYSTHLMCLVCHCPFIRPIRLKCDHIFCQTCLNGWILSSPAFDVDEFLCPTCRTPTHANFTTVPRLVIAMCDDILVNCPFSTEGCTEVVQRGYVQTHVDKYCDYKLVRCPDVICEKKIRKKDLAPELKCLHQLHDCDKCGESITELELDEHTKELCSQTEVTCSDCDKTLIRAELEAHTKSCLKATQSCQASKYGCPVILRKAEIEDHEKSCPLVSLGPYLGVQSTRIASMDSTIKQLKQQNELLEEGIASMRSTLAQTAPRPASRVSIAPPIEAGIEPSDAPLPIVQQGQGETPTRPGNTSLPTNDTPSTNTNTTTYLLSIHESLRDEVTQLSAAVTDLDARASMSMMNENLRIREDMAHFTAGLNTVRMQVHMLMNSRLQGQRSSVNPQGPSAANAAAAVGVSSMSMPGPSTGQSRMDPDSSAEPQRNRRLSDGGGTKL